MIAYLQFPAWFLQWLKEWNDAGVIDAIIALGTLGAVFTALLPMIANWWRRPMLRLEIPGNYLRTSATEPTEGITYGQSTVSVSTSHSPHAANLGPPVKEFTTASLIVRNIGSSAAVSVRLALTDQYKVLPDRKDLAAMRSLPQHNLISSDDLAGGLLMSVPFLHRVRIDETDSGVQFGPSTNVHVKTVNNVRTISINPHRKDFHFGEYVVRLVISASNARPSTVLLKVTYGDDGIKLLRPDRRTSLWVKSVDSSRAKPQVIG